MKHGWCIMTSRRSDCDAMYATHVKSVQHNESKTAVFYSSLTPQLTLVSLYQKAAKLRESSLEAINPL